MEAHQTETDMPDKLFVIVSKNPDGTSQACGPIDDFHDAVMYADQYPAGVEWQVVELFCPA
jgi:hypothetical protein